MKMQPSPQAVEEFESSGEECAIAPASIRLPSEQKALAVSVEASEGVALHFPWAGVLVEAALLCPAEERRSVKVCTQWSDGNADSCNPDEADELKHVAYSEHMLRVFHNVYPWLIPLLDSSRATLLVSPGMCCFTVQSRLGFVFDIAPLIPLTHLTPFAADKADTIH